MNFERTLFDQTTYPAQGNASTSCLQTETLNDVTILYLHRVDDQYDSNSTYVTSTTVMYPLRQGFPTFQLLRPPK